MTMARARFLVAVDSADLTEALDELERLDPSRPEVPLHLRCRLELLARKPLRGFALEWTARGLRASPSAEFLAILALLRAYAPRAPEAWRP